MDWSYQPDDVLLDRELREVMENAIAALPEALRIAFIWRELEGLSTAETAEVLGISEGTVKVRLHRARLKLREMLSEGYLAAVGQDAANADSPDEPSGENGHG